MSPGTRRASMAPTSSAPRSISWTIRRRSKPRSSTSTRRRSSEPQLKAMTTLVTAATRAQPDNKPERRRATDLMPFAWSILLDAVPFALIVLDPQDHVVTANHAGEQLLGAGRTLLNGKPLSDYIAGDSPVITLISEARTGSIAVAEPDLALSGPKLQAAHVAIDAAPIAEQPGHVVLVVKDRSIERR